MLYHYTDFIAFDGILGNTELRLNNVLNMNDATEMRFFMEGLCKAIVKQLRDNGLTDRAHKVERFFMNELGEEFNYSAYAACFSRYRDDAAQWERYGKYGEGICIAFHEDMLQRITEATSGVVSMRDVYYGQDFTTLETAQKFYDLLTSDRNFNDYLDELQNLFTEAWVMSAAFKHPSFASENEVRMVVTPFVSQEFQVTPKYHVSLGRIKKYYPMNLREMCRKALITMEDLVAEVMIGPTSTQSPAILQDYLYDKGYKNLAGNVSISQCPLRKPNS